MNYKVSLRRTLLTSVAAGVMALSATVGLSSDANAEAYALSHVEVNSMDVDVFRDAGLGAGFEEIFRPFQSVPVEDPVGSGTFVNKTPGPFSAKTSSSINFSGAAPNQTGLAPFAFDDTTSVNPGQHVTGAVTSGEDSYAPTGAFSGGLDSATFARADHLLSNTKINPGGGGTGAGAFQSIAESQASGKAGIAAATHLQQWTFAQGDLEAGDKIVISGNAFVHLIAALFPDASETGFALAEYNLSLKVNGSNKGLILNGSAGVSIGSNNSVSVNGTSPLTDEVFTTAGGGGVGAPAFEDFDFTVIVGASDLVDGNSNPSDVTFDITFSSEAQAISTAIVPEPGALGVLAIGLLGLGAATRRRPQVVS